MWRVLRQLEDELAGIGGELLTTVHDSILWQSPAASVARSIEVARIVMEQPFDEIAPGFRVPVVVKTGSNWGEMHEVVGITQ
jgi:DNA polymerase I-like protein with 3'-5' exonuclease and polymerase domains